MKGPRSVSDAAAKSGVSMQIHRFPVSLISTLKGLNNASNWKYNIGSVQYVCGY